MRWKIWCFHYGKFTPCWPRRDTILGFSIVLACVENQNFKFQHFCIFQTMILTFTCKCWSSIENHKNLFSPVLVFESSFASTTHIQYPMNRNLVNFWPWMSVRKLSKIYLSGFLSFRIHLVQTTSTFNINKSSINHKKRSEIHSKLESLFFFYFPI